MKTKNNFKKYALLLSVVLLQAGYVMSQTQTPSNAYQNSGKNRSFYYGERSGMLDTTAKNPASSGMGSNMKSVKYVRKKENKFDNIKLNFTGKLNDINKYAVHTGTPSKISMMVYTTAPVGTPIEIQLGKAGKSTYPANTHSIYQGRTTMSNAWEEVKFTFSEIPQGSKTAANEVDQVTILFNPNSSTSDTYYFYNLTGPSIMNEKVESAVPPVDNTKTVPPVTNDNTGGMK
jgi:hypothetical protein